MPPKNTCLGGSSPNKKIDVSSPVTGLLTSIFLLGEDPPAQVFLGGFVIISGVALILFTKKNKKNE